MAPALGTYLAFAGICSRERVLALATHSIYDTNGEQAVADQALWCFGDFMNYPNFNTVRFGGLTLSRAGRTILTLPKQRPSERSGKTWTATRYKHLYRHKSRTYNARLRIAGKQTWPATSLLSVAQHELNELLAEEGGDPNFRSLASTGLLSPI